MLGGRAIDAEVGQLQVEQVAAPQQRVERVVGRVGGEGEVADQRRQAQSASATAAQRPGRAARACASQFEPGLRRVSVALSI